MHTNDPWKKLSNDARRRPRPTGAPAEMPWGFAAGVLARLQASSPGATELWARLALRAVPLGAGALLLCWIALPSRSLPSRPAPDMIEQLMQEVLIP